MAKRKMATDRDFERGERALDELVEAMAGMYVASTYDCLLEAAALLKDRLPATYRPSEIPVVRQTTDEWEAGVATFARLEIYTAKYGTPEYRAAIFPPLPMVPRAEA